MSNGVTFKYHLPHRIILSVIFAGMWIPLLWVGGNLSLDTLLFVALNVAVVLAGIWSVSVIEIGQNGVTLYRVNKLDWSDVSSAKKVLFLGLPHIRVGRKKGLPIWIPLYFQGKRPIGDALAACAPGASALNQVELGAKTS